MGLLILVGLGTALWLIFRSVFGPKWWLIIAVFVVSFFVTTQSIYTECFDGRDSLSIGIQGACSRHGGVFTRANNLGLILLFLSALIIIVYYIIPYEKRMRWPGNIEIDEIDIIKEAIEKGKEIEFDYNKFVGKEKYKIIPLEIKFNGRKRFVKGYYKNSSKNRTYDFLINKMSKIKIIG